MHFCVTLQNAAFSMTTNESTLMGIYLGALRYLSKEGDKREVLTIDPLIAESMAYDLCLLAKVALGRYLQKMFDCLATF